MSFFDEYVQLKQLPFEEIWQNTTVTDVKQILQKERLHERDFLALLSPAAHFVLEEMAQKAHRLTVQHFGKTVSLFTPMYIADYCVNQCVYCSFSINNKFERKKLTMEEIEREAQQIASTGMKHLLILTGESPQETPVSYIKESVQVLRKYFPSLSIEINPLDTNEYVELVEAGVDGLTIFQEVYNEEIYKEVHEKGPKRNYRNRLDAPERGCQAGMRTVTIGALLGIDEWRKEVFFTGMHAKYLQRKYSGTDISLSIPRMRPHLGSYQPKSIVDDKDLVQVILAYRLFLPQCGLTLSTRERPELRDRLFRLGITKMSAGVSTQVGGYSNEETGVSQFEISDERNVDEIYSMLIENGYQPVFKNWEPIS